MTLRPLSAAFSEDPPLPALLLDETPDDKATLVLPPRTFNPGRRVALARRGTRAPLPADAARCSAAPTSSASRSKTIA